MATHSSVLGWRIPGMGEHGGLPSMGSYRVGHDWSDLAVAAVSPLSFTQTGFLLLFVLVMVIPLRCLQETKIGYLPCFHCYLHFLRSIRGLFVNSSTGAHLSLASGNAKWRLVVQLLSPVQLCNPMDCSTPDFPVLHYLLELAQTLIHWVGEAIQPSCPLLSPSPPTSNPSQHQGLF